jgi:20S proteasome alpha/beta subunit
MTVCVAAVCEERKAIVIPADKMIGMGFIEAEPDIEKIQRIHKDWWAMFSGDDISPVFDILSRASTRLAPTPGPLALDVVIEAVTRAFQETRLITAENLYLRSRGWTFQEFRTLGSKNLPESTYREIDFNIQDFTLPVTLLVAGFEKNGAACIFSVSNPGSADRHDVPGFHAIGSGNYGALHMMFIRELSHRTPLARAIYYTFEAKYHGELASGVGVKTDMYILRSGQEAKKLEEKSEDKLVKMCERLEPKQLGKKDLESLKGLPEVQIETPIVSVRSDTMTIATGTQEAAGTAITEAR